MKFKNKERREASALARANFEAASPEEKERILDERWDAKCKRDGIPNVGRISPRWSGQVFQKDIDAFHKRMLEEQEPIDH